jgi:hypothetical protein
MAERVLVLISEDPRSSHRAHEALRIALGIVAGENDVAIVLDGPATHLLDADTDDLVDGDDIAKVRDSLRRLDVPMLITAGSRPADPDWNSDGHPVREVAVDDVAAEAGRAARVLAF